MKEITHKTEHLLLRPLRFGDEKAIHEYAGDKSITMMMFLPNDTFEETKEFVKNAVDEWQKDVPENLEFAVEYQGKLIGGADLEFYEDRKKVELGWILHKDYRGRGLGTETAMALKEIAFTKLGLEKVVAHCDINNKCSLRTMQNIGLKITSDNGERTYPKTGKKSLEYRCELSNYYPTVIESERMILRPLFDADMQAIFKWTGDPEVTRYMIYPQYNSTADGLLWMAGLYKEEKQLDYGFVLKETGELIGSGGMYYQKMGGKRDLDDTWGIGYNLRRDALGKGIATEAMETILNYARKNFEVKKIGGTFALENNGSRRVMEKLGMTFLRDSEYTKLDGSATFKAKTYIRVF
ncbi:MAG: GNAT family N-acetyltransferase [Treponema sp.]|nr:GNAT family N-acetyltransferase [Treponema sp.]